MSSFPSACTTLHASPSSREHPCDLGGVILSHGGCVTIDHAQMLGPELGLAEMSEVECTHLQHLIQAQMEVHVAPPEFPAARSHPAPTVTVKDGKVTSPSLTTQAIDLSTSTDEHNQAMPGEKTPASHGEVPGFVLARVRGEDSPTELRANSSTYSRSRSAARVCLEKRFNTLSADTPRQQDIQSAVLSNFLTMLQQSAEAQEAVIHLTTDRDNPFEVSSPYAGGVFNTNMCEQVMGHNPHMVDPNKHQGLIKPKFSFNFRPERVVTKAHYTSGSHSTEEQQFVTPGDDAATPAAFKKLNTSRPSKAASAREPGSSTSKRARSHLSLIQRREVHNSKERKRRKMIRLYCDELNTLVPFCESDTDKVSTLQWTTTFLRYIKKTYGDTLKEEFQKAFAEGKGRFLKSSPSSGPDPIHREEEEEDTLSVPLSVEQ
ncbi:transcription factor-like 5 protein [Cebidichthys violaceus]|uniref:transcription factor-like 5 protein n=1 Tax=Cebidichthys violaceus TaxID=271503 RepID=UPI0035C990A7